MLVLGKGRRKEMLREEVDRREERRGRLLGRRREIHSLGRDGDILLRGEGGEGSVGSEGGEGEREEAFLL